MGITRPTIRPVIRSIVRAANEMVGGGVNNELLAEVGTFTSTAGPQDVTLSNFGGETPKAVLIWHSGSTADGVAAGSKMGFGAAVSASSRAAITTTSEDGQGTSDADRRHTNAKF